MSTPPVKYWELLKESDQQILGSIRAALSAPTLKNKRNTRIADLKEIIETLKIFQYHCEEDTWKRLLVTGFVDLDEGFAVNVTQLHTLILKCKSSINGSLRRMGYATKITTVSAFNKLFEAIPALKTNATELRQWTIRKKSDVPPDDATSDGKEDDEAETSNDNKSSFPSFMAAFDVLDSLFD
jgi:hypothetical protein